MTEQLVWEDYLTIGLYFAIVLAVGLWVILICWIIFCKISLHIPYLMHRSEYLANETQQQKDYRHHVDATLK